MDIPQMLLIVLSISDNVVIGARLPDITSVFLVAKPLEG